MEWRDGKLYISREDCADYMTDLALIAATDGSRQALQAAARDCYTQAADPTAPTPAVTHAAFSQIAGERLLLDRIEQARPY